MAIDTLDRLVGQLFFFGFHGRSLDAGFLRHYRRYPAGGFIVFGRNAGGIEQFRGLTAALNDLAGEVRGEAPLLAADQEGGNLSPLRGLVTPLPGNMALAATGDISAAYYAGYVTGRDLRGLGVNVAFAPVLDLAVDPANPVIGTRAFSDSPETVAAFGKAMAQGLAAAGALFTAKHFPGHGSCREDSHVTLATCAESRRSLWERDLLPFRAVLGLDKASVMMAHVRYEALDPAQAASLSGKVINGLLRGDMGFDGVVFTDDLEMGAIKNLHPPAEAAVMALEAGADIVLVCHTPADQAACFDGVKQAVRSGRLPLARIEESVRRIAAWRGRAGIAADGALTPAWTPATLAEGAIALAGRAETWPYNREPLAVVAPAPRTVTPAEDAGDLEPFFRALAALSVPCLRIPCDTDPDKEEIEKVAGEIASKSIGRTALVLRDPFRHAGQRGLASRLAESGRVMLISVRDPREVLAVGLDYACAAAYCSEPPVLEALAKVLAGALPPRGRVPVNIKNVDRCIIKPCINDED